MKKRVLLDHRAVRELKVFDRKVQLIFDAYFVLLKQEGRLSFPESQKFKNCPKEVKTI